MCQIVIYFTLKELLVLSLHDIPRKPPVLCPTPFDPLPAFFSKTIPDKMIHRSVSHQDDILMLYGTDDEMIGSNGGTAGESAHGALR